MSFSDPAMRLKVLLQTVHEVAFIYWTIFKFIYYFIFWSWASKILCCSSSIFCFNYRSWVKLSAYDCAKLSTDGFSTITGSSANAFSSLMKNLILLSLAFWILSSMIFCLLASALAYFCLRFSETVSNLLIRTCSLT